MAEPNDDITKPLSFDMLAAFEKPAAPARVGIPGYTIVRELARGGMGAVYLARQLRPEQNHPVFHASTGSRVTKPVSW